jgi:hypothetical protein
MAGFLRKGNGSEWFEWQEGRGLSPPRIVIWADLDGFCIWGEHAEMFYEKALWDPTRSDGHGYRIT